MYINTYMDREKNYKSNCWWKRTFIIRDGKSIYSYVQAE